MTAAELLVQDKVWLPRPWTTIASQVTGMRSRVANLSEHLWQTSPDPLLGLVVNRRAPGDMLVSSEPAVLFIDLPFVTLLR